MGRAVHCIEVTEGFAIVQVGGDVDRNENGLLVPKEGTAIVIFDSDMNYDVRASRITEEELDLAFFAALAAFLKEGQKR